MIDFQRRSNGPTDKSDVAVTVLVLTSAWPTLGACGFAARVHEVSLRYCDELHDFIRQ